MQEVFGAFFFSTGLRASLTPWCDGHELSSTRRSCFPAIAPDFFSTKKHQVSHHQHWAWLQNLKAMLQSIGFALLPATLPLAPPQLRRYPCVRPKPRVWRAAETEHRSREGKRRRLVVVFGLVISSQAFCRISVFSKLGILVLKVLLLYAFVAFCPFWWQKMPPP